MEEKLAEYRARKRIEEMLPSMFKKVNGSLSLPGSSNSKHVTFATEDIESSKALLEDEGGSKLKSTRNKENSDVGSSLDLDTSEEEIGCPKWSILTIASYTLYFLLWLTLYAIAVNVEFGAVYFIVSTLFLIWKNTRTTPKKKGEISAYSVFNPDCQAIDGTLNAEQFEREIRFGAASMH